ncbi:hypothetical protein A2631_05940 [Candidatus Daviesbacteria bacterium RIFCSPHIGHO2_01_FULL_44_29]|uniref:Uncharacterized protein n=1 Tax=Candidatus Daviesbacteria bacterium RIFCSPHIGHO2_02_FULL_43_12 TaxID=1797776 RepID=A0A1F5KJ19_9BACT|nr:MAG: hypothetical protein A2631_05940 [Candidatus Daviesbacteria bacterium RIFCSPHIGHO2_01_FULL_44_29]OGE39134.1 MAG: hypothetical protein A3E86_03270 [Candidatus Daviesbacteria bacterium RIFCSPHIGHO2_12_FULL_47_45]OGE40936.1 MAG: hypothetical protein A3D25_02770 [Candidatus Daviesbacteria bacterium RIFCSPHIGHO2_02_FULL_43_12]OGE69913.1 MAG: hypothetical protein A3B55_05900 [Candidatus Daviesbacteria bacterium RIFCSPLOWO2_01_FULL_43_15]
MSRKEKTISLLKSAGELGFAHKKILDVLLKLPLTDKDLDELSQMLEFFVLEQKRAIAEFNRTSI